MTVLASDQGIMEPQMEVMYQPATSRFYYRVGPHLILLETTLKAEVLMTQTVYPLPFKPSWCAGLASVRGDLLPVLDMYQIVLGRPVPANFHLLLIQLPDSSPVLLTCEGYPRQVKLTSEQLQPHQDDKLPSWIPYTLHCGEDIFLAADHDKLLRHIRRLAKG